MNIKEILKIKGSLKYVFITFVIFLFVIGLFFKLSIDYQNTQMVKANILNMQKTIDEYNNLATKINNETYRPIDTKQLDTVQTSILNNLAKNSLFLEKFSEKESKQTVKKEKAVSFREYNISFFGEWVNVINTVTNFTSISDALITIEKIQFSSEKNNDVKVDMVYRIYTK